MTLTDTEKAAAARKSLEYVKDGMVVGLGSGSTATFIPRCIIPVTTALSLLR